MHFIAKILILVVIINMMFVFGGVSNIGSGLLAGMFSINVDNESNYYVSGLSENFSGNVPTGGVGGGFETGSSDLNFFDGLKTISGFIFGFLLSTLLAPINIMMGLGVTGIFGMMIGIPLTVAYIFGFVLLIRGIS